MPVAWAISRLSLPSAMPVNCFFKLATAGVSARPRRADVLPETWPVFRGTLTGQVHGEPQPTHERSQKLAAVAARWKFPAKTSIIAPQGQVNIVGFFDLLGCVGGRFCVVMHMVRACDTQRPGSSTGRHLRRTGWIHRGVPNHCPRIMRATQHGPQPTHGASTLNQLALPTVHSKTEPTGCPFLDQDPSKLPFSSGTIRSPNHAGVSSTKTPPCPSLMFT